MCQPAGWYPEYLRTFLRVTLKSEGKYLYSIYNMEIDACEWIKNNVIYLYLHPFVRNVPKHLQYEAYEGTFVPSRVTRKQAEYLCAALMQKFAKWPNECSESIINDEQSDGKIDTDTGFLFFCSWRKSGCLRKGNFHFSILHGSWSVCVCWKQPIL